jgi:hypothetical protein
MKGVRSTLMLMLAMGVVALAGFTLDAATRPEPLRAQSCGRFDGNLCQSNCTRECSDGSCCSWSYYYYEKVPPIRPSTPG